MKVFDVSFANDSCMGRQPIPVFAEDAASAVRIAVRNANKSREGQFLYDTFGRPTKPLPEITAEEVVKVEVVRHQVAY